MKRPLTADQLTQMANRCGTNRIHLQQLLKGLELREAACAADSFEELKAVVLKLVLMACPEDSHITGEKLDTAYNAVVRDK